MVVPQSPLYPDALSGLGFGMKSPMNHVGVHVKALLAPVGGACIGASTQAAVEVKNHSS